MTMMYSNILLLCTLRDNNVARIHYTQLHKKNNDFFVDFV